MKQHEAITFDNLFAGDQSSMSAASYIVGPMSVLMGNDYEKLEIDGLDVTFKTTEEPMTATLERVWLDDPRPRAGRTVPLKVMFRTYRGEEVVRTLPIEIPANASGSLSLLVSDGARLGQNEQREARAPQPRSVDQIIRTLNRGRRNNSLYIKLLGSDAGAVVSGLKLPPLRSPSSTLRTDGGSADSNSPLTTAPASDASSLM